MTDHQQTTYPKPVQTNEDHQLDEGRVSLEAESLVHITTFPMVFKAALELGVIDTITKADKGVWLSPSEIALALPTKPTNPEAPVMLDRMLRLLASNSILKCRTVETGATKKLERVYQAEPVCKFFLTDSDSSGSFASQFMLMQTQDLFSTWYRALHNWRDEDCVKILRNCWKSLPEKGKVVILDMVLPIEPKDDTCLSNLVYSLDVSMLTYCSGGKERSLSEFEDLALKSGFSRCEVICRVISYSVIELYK